jgi:hydrogenase nickel incorporation protein HypB
MKIAVNRNLLSANQERAAGNRRLFLRHGLRVVNVMSSPGAGKTTLLSKTAAYIAGRVPVAVLVGDISTETDAEKIRNAAPGVQAEQIVTEKYGSACRLDARMISEALPRLDLARARLLFIENVGNLVCPAGLYLGEDRRVVLLSVPEGDDKVIKYPVIFRDADCLLITKVDLAPACDFDAAKVRKEARAIKPSMEVLSISARTGEGLERWFHWLEERVTGTEKGGE